jgi:hypothetical protein
MTSGNYLFEIGFMGEELENKTISIYIDDKPIFTDIFLKEIPYNVYKFDVGVGFRNNTFELYSLRNGGVILREKDFEINDLHHIKIGIDIDGIISNQIISVKKGKYFYLKYDDNKVQILGDVTD